MKKRLDIIDKNAQAVHYRNLLKLTELYQGKPLEEVEEEEGEEEGEEEEDEVEEEV